MKIEFLGAGSAFTLPPKGGPLNTCDFQSNLLVHAKNGKKLLLDCGSDIRFSLAQAEHTLSSIDSLYVSHAHADHIGGMEYLAFSTYFNPTMRRMGLYLSSSLTKELWDYSLRGGLESIEGKNVAMTEYFDVHPIKKNGWFTWEGICLELVQVVHIMTNRVIRHSYGLMMQEGTSPKVFWTSDTQFCPHQIKRFYEQADVILHDCETGFPSGVHAHYDDLRTLPESVRLKMYLYHYQPDGPEKYNARADGFRGFARKGDILTVRANSKPFWRHRK